MSIYEDKSFKDYVAALPAASESDLAAGNNMPIVTGSTVKKIDGGIIEPTDKEVGLNGVKCNEEILYGYLNRKFYSIHFKDYELINATWQGDGSLKNPDPTTSGSYYWITIGEYFPLESFQRIVIKGCNFYRVRLYDENKRLVNSTGLNLSSVEPVNIDRKAKYFTFNIRVNAANLYEAMKKASAISIVVVDSKSYANDVSYLFTLSGIPTKLTDFNLQVHCLWDSSTHKFRANKEDGYTWIASEKFFEIPEFNFKVSINGFSFRRVLFYDKDKTYIGNIENVSYFVKSSIPSNTKYFTFNLFYGDGLIDFEDLPDVLDGCFISVVNIEYENVTNIQLECLNLKNAYWTYNKGVWNEGPHAESGLQWISSVNYFKIPEDDYFKIEFSATPARILFYGENKSYLGSAVSVLNKSVITELDIPTGAKYFTINFRVPGDTVDVAIDIAKTYCFKIYCSVNYYTFNELTYFSSSVATTSPFKHNYGLVTDSQTNDNLSYADDYGIIMLPSGHSLKSKPLKIVMFFHGSGEPVYCNSSKIASFKISNYFVHCGYAVIAVNGLPQSYATKNSLSYGRPVGNYMGIESANKAIAYCAKQFNLDVNEIYVYGESQGGMCAMNFVESGAYNVVSVVLDSPAISMRYSQLNISGALNNMLHFYGFNNVANYDSEKVCGLDPYARNCSSVEDAADYQKNGNVITEVSIATCSSTRISKAPTKFFLGQNDGVCPAFASQIVYKQMKNAGQFAECLIYQGIGHCVDQNAAAVGNFENYGNSYELTQVMKDEAAWWCRFGGNEPK